MGAVKTSISQSVKLWFTDTNQKSGNSELNIDDERLRFDKHVFWRNALQTALIGFLVMVGLALFLTDGQMSLGDLFHPIILVPPILLAPIIGAIRALK